MRPRKLATLLTVVGLLCLPAPLYLGWVAGAATPAQRTSQIYAAERLDPANASDRAEIADGYGTAVALSTHQLSGTFAVGDFRAPEETRRTLEAAMRTGSATTSDPGAQADLRRIGRNYAFVYDEYADDEQYYRLRVREDGSAVRATNVTVDRVANATVDAAVDYADLSPGERRTVDRIVANSTGGGDGYRPREDAPFVDRLPALVRKDGRLYGLYVYGWVDDFGPAYLGTVAGVVVALAGVVLLVASVAYWHGARGEGDDQGES